MLAALGLSLQRVLSHLRGDTENSQDRKPKTFTTEDTKEHRGKIGKAKPYHE
jgi:hypothetical protein